LGQCDQSQRRGCRLGLENAGHGWPSCIMWLLKSIGVSKWVEQNNTLGAG
jgi:hypothetical protein